MLGSLFEWLYYALPWQAQVAIAGIIALAVALTLLLYGF